MSRVAHTNKQMNTGIYPASGLSREIKPLLQHLAYSVYSPVCICDYKGSSSCMSKSTSARAMN